MRMPASVASVVITSALIASAGCDGLCIACGLGPTTSLNGQWVGSTDQGKPIALTVQSGAVTNVSVAYRLDQAGCSQEAVDSTAMSAPIGTPAAPLAFSSQYSSVTSPMTVKITGTFDINSPRSASGTVTWTAIPSVAPCSGDTKITWRVTKQ